MNTGLVSEPRRWRDGFAIEGIVWRRSVDWVVLHVPSVLHAPLNWIATLLFFFIAAPARKAVLRHLYAVLPRTSLFGNYLRVFRVFSNFGWMLTDSAVYRLLDAPFDYELEGEQFLQQLATSAGAIILTAHMGNYDLGASVFAAKIKRQISMVRAPEPDSRAAKHIDQSLEQASAGGVKVGYSSDGTALAFDLLSGVRNGDIVSIQGDRVVGDVARSPVRLFGQTASLPAGPFVLGLAAERPIYPLFVIRVGYRKYRVIACAPITCSRNGERRDKQIAEAMQRWATVLEEQIRRYWPQWYAFRPLF